jgi:hypothetical protein
MNMRVEGHEVAEGLHVQDEGWLAARFHGLEAGVQQSGNQLAQCAQITATIAEEGPDQLRQRKHVLPMRHRGEHMFFQPLAVGEHSLLMTARAEVTGLAGVGEQVITTALIAIDAREALMQIAAGEETLEDFGFDRPLEQLCCVELFTVASNTLI